MNNQKHILIFGGGVSGLCTAHELINKGYKVSVYEAAKYLGGKPITWEGFPFTIDGDLKTSDDFTKWANESKLDVADDTILPGEHAFRVFPENYNNLLSIMKEIPLGNGKDVTSQFVDKIQMAAVIPEGLTPNNTFSQKVKSFLELILFGMALYFPYMFCDERALKQYDVITFADLMQYKNRTPEMKDFLDRIAGSAASGNPKLMSAISTINLLMNYRTAPNSSGLRTFGLPTAKAWINPWIDLLKSKGVKFYTDHKLEGFDYDIPEDNTLSRGERDSKTKIKGAYVSHNGTTTYLQADYYVSAIPVNILNDIFNGTKGKSQILRYDPRLSAISQIVTLPASGAQLFYEKRIPEIQNKGFGFQNLNNHMWELSIIPQTGYWLNPNQYAGNYEVISIYIAVTYAQGNLLFKGKNLAGQDILTKKTMVECTPQEIAAEMFIAFEIMLKNMYPNIIIPKRVGYFCHNFANKTPQYIIDKEEKAIQYDEFGSSLSPFPLKGGAPSFTDDKGVYHFLDENPYDEERLHLCVPKMYDLRLPSDNIYANNLVIVGAHTQTSTYYVSTMETAAESAKRGVCAILQNDGIPPITIIKEVQLPWYIKASRRIDKCLYKLHLGNPLNVLLNCFRTVNSTNAHINPIVYSATNFGSQN